MPFLNRYYSTFSNWAFFKEKYLKYNSDCNVSIRNHLSLPNSLPRELNKCNFCGNGIDSQSELSVIVKTACTWLFFKMACYESRSWELSWTNVYQFVQCSFFVLHMHGMLQVWTCLQLAALKEAKNCWRGQNLSTWLVNNSKLE